MSNHFSAAMLKFPDVHADAAFSFVFSESDGAGQTATVYYATGSQARDPEPVGEVLIEGTPVGFDAMATPVQAGECRLFVGVRSDPFFADGEGAFHDFQFTVDNLKNAFNAGHPADDVADYLTPWSQLLESRGYPPAEARETALTVLPDILHYDRDRLAHYPNGRAVTDDVYDVRMAFLTHGRVTADGVGPHDDYLAEFPFLGIPHPQASGEAMTAGGLLTSEQA